MGKRRDFLERLSKDDPNYEVAKRFHLEAWADSYDLTADAFAGRVALSEFVERCVKTFAQGARTHVLFKDDTPLKSRCKELDGMAKKFIRVFSEKLTSESERLGETDVKEAIDQFSRRVNEIAARSKQRMFKAELTRNDDARGGRVKTVTPKPKPRQPPVTSVKRILGLLAKSGKSGGQVTYSDIEQCARQYRQVNPDAIFAPELKSILAHSDFALENRALLRGNWNEAKLSAADPQRWQHLARQFEALAAREAEELLQYREPLVISGNHIECHWTTNRDDSLSLRFDVLASEAGQCLGRGSRAIQNSIQQTKAQSWSDFWKYCLWFHLGEPSNSTIGAPVKASVNLCLHLALHSESVENQDDTMDTALGLPDNEPPNSSKAMVRAYLKEARSKTRATVETLVSGRQPLEQAAAALELDARIWGQGFHDAILAAAASEGLPPDQFEKRAVASALEIVAMAVREFSVWMGRDTTDGATPMFIGRFPAMFRSDQPPAIDTRDSIGKYLKKALADYPNEYREQNLSVYKLTHGAETVEDLTRQRGVREELSAIALGPDVPAATVAVTRKERRALRDDYKSECNQHGVSVTDLMIAEAASVNWHNRTAIQKWLACDPRYDGEPDRLIRSVFVRKPHITGKT